MGNCCERLLPKQVADVHQSLTDETPKVVALNSEVDFPSRAGFDSASTAIGSIQTLPSISPLDSQLRLIPQAIQENISLIIQQWVPMDCIVALQNHFFDQVGQHRHSLTKIKEGTFPEFTEAETYAENVSKESGFEVINVFLQSYKSTFTPEFELFGYLNQVVPLLHSLDQYEILHQEAYEDTIFLVERVRTQRVLVIASRHMITLRIIRKLPDGRILDVSQSIEHNDLLRYPSLKRLHEEKVLKEPASILIAGRYFEVREGKCVVTTFSKVDFHSSIPLKFATIFLKKTFDQFFDSLGRNAQQHLQEDVFRSKNDLIWFRNSQTQRLLEPSFIDNKELARIGPTIVAHSA
jgi:hypothetical protein